MSTTPFLERIGLNPEEQKVYLALLALGPLTAGEIAKYTGIKPISKVSSILESLFSKNYAYNIEGLVDKVIGLYPFREIAQEAGKDGERIDALVVELKQYVAEQIKHFEQVMKQTEDFVNAEKDRSNKKIAETSEAARVDIDNKNAEAGNAIKTNMEATKTKIKNESEAFLKTQTDATQAYETGTNTNLDAFASNVKTKSSTALKQMGEAIKTKNSEYLTQGIATINTASTSITSHADKLAGTLKEDSKTNLEGTSKHLITGLNNFVTQTTTNVDGLNSSLTAATNDQATQIKTIAEEAKKNRIDLNIQFKEGVASSFEKVKEEFGVDFSTFEESFNSQLTKIADEFKKQIDKINASTALDIKGLIENANASVGDIALKHNEEIATNVDLDNKAVTDGTAKMLAKISSQNNATIQAINTSIGSLKTNTTQLKTKYNEDVKTQVDKTITGMHSTIDTTVQETKEYFG